MNKLVLPERFRGKPEYNVWVEFNQLAQQYKPLNLGQGFPDYGCPKHVTDALKSVMDDSNLLLNQYTRGYGHPRLVSVLSRLYSEEVGRSIDPNTEILVSQGAYGCLHNAVLGHVSPGDEVIIVEPYFDCYEPLVRIAGGVPVFVPLRPSPGSDPGSAANWQLQPDELAAAFNERTKMFILNTPHNPLGKVFSRAELEQIAGLCRTHDTLVLSDEVYEWMVFEEEGEAVKHVRICTLPDMWQRTITVGSAGKTFSVTGWKLGWAYGPAPLIRHLQVVHQNSLYTCSTPLQEALARAFEAEMGLRGKPDCFLTSLAVELRAKRDKMAAALRAGGLSPVLPQGGYFMLADWSQLPRDRIDLTRYVPDKPDDHRFVYWLVQEHGLQGIPPSSFYSDQNKRLADNYIRFCFIKDDKNLEKAEQILKSMNKALTQ